MPVELRQPMLVQLRGFSEPMLNLSFWRFRAIGQADL